MSREALAKLMYSNLFDEIVRKTNLSFKTAATVHKFVAVLDIYGFEQFEVRKSILLIPYSEDQNNENSNTVGIRNLTIRKPDVFEILF